MEERTHIVPASADGERLDRFLAAAEPALSRSQVARAIADGRVRVDGVVAGKAGAKLAPGASVVLVIPPPAPAAAVAQAIPLVIRHEDGDVVVVAKPAGMVVHPAHGHSDGTLVNALLHHCDDLSGVGGVQRPGVVHRLDRDTSGLLVVAKNDAAHRGLAAQFKDRSAYRRYLAIVAGGSRMETEGTFRTRYGRHPTDRKRFSSRVRQGKEAVTHWRVLLHGDEAGGVAAHVVEARLETGRTHQIRAHFADAGHPVVADPLYAGRARPPHAALAGLARQALHAYALGFTHPTTGARLTFREPPPADLRAALDGVWGASRVTEALAPLLEPVDRAWG